MARQQNFYYQADPTAQIAGNLARALFGDPQAAAAQEAQAAELAQARAQTRSYDALADYRDAQTQGVSAQNAAAANLPELFALMSGNVPAAQASPQVGFQDWLGGAALPGAPAENDLLAGTPMADAPPPPPPATGVAANLPALLANMGIMQGDGIDAGQLMGTYGAFMGGDELARRGMIAQGKTPGENFALTSTRADAISARDAAEDYTKATGVAEINNRDNIAIENIRAGADRDVATINNRDDIAVANIRAGSGQSRGERNNNPGNLEYGDFARRFGATGSDGRFAIFPDFESGVKAQEALLSGKSYLGGGVNTIGKIIRRYAPTSDGNNVNNYAAFVTRVTGIPADQALSAADIPKVAEAMRRFETGGNLRPGGKTSGSKGTPAKVTSAELNLLSKQVESQLEGHGAEGHPDKPKVAANIYAKAVEIYKANGRNPAAAVQQAIRESIQRGDAIRGGAEASAPPPVTAQTRRRGAPTLDQFLAKARAANPDVSDADLTSYYQREYGA